jgi:dihydropteroate synthase
MMTEVQKKSHEFKCGDVVIDFSRRTYIMGVLNVTPDSFSDGGKFFSRERAVDHALQMIAEGADIIDIGGESTRPKGPYGEGSEEITAEEEMRRVLPVVKELAGRTQTLISIDTYKASVADAALSEGASIVNDISGLTFDENMGTTVAKHRATLIAMHIKGTPKTMQRNPFYENVIEEIKSFLKGSVSLAHAAGIEQVMIDPGIGFGKKDRHNLLIIKHLHEFQELDCPIVIGPSRKGFLGRLLDLPVDQRVEGTAAAVAASIINGANVVRVHDVKEMKRIAIVTDAIAQVE